ncbi:HAMP domain-containing sensor histidine kinase [Brevundimonas sp.]|uniref:sensor histidine kinase n=1 Tax=Brevundimonas sp. TaxID=1871086 RepID=UPI0025E98A6E|nr:HAMP domain-containing sensor histidine kinase [Brevundimonas sp.]
MSPRPKPSSAFPAAELAPASLEVADEAARRSFLRMMSHELRTPLNSIIGFSDILSSELYGPLGAPQYKDYADIIHLSGQRLLRLVNQALEIIRLEAGAADLDIHAVPVDAAVDDAAQLLAEEAEARGVSIAFDPPVPAPLALADARGLRTAIGNLLQNALTHSPDGGVIHVSLTTEGPLVVVTIADEGDGLDPADIPRLMRAFEQGENALVRRKEGAGLGWPLVRLLIKAMGGDFRVEAASGEGLTARITLRRAG